jgi:serine/threonine protein phosphatase PrpC
MRTGVPERPLQIEHADLSLLGNREENQDRVAIAMDDDAAFLAVVDGMGGHADGARAAEVAIRTMVTEFWEASRPLFDPDGFLHLTLGRAHEAVVALGRALPAEIRPRATCAACLVQGSNAYWAHIGDSRVYLLRGGRILERTRDHSHVELLLRSGRITERQALDHPMRNYVECCIGGDPALPEMSLGGRRALKPGDVVLLTTPPAFRWPMFQYAIEKGLHTFMEKPVTVDGPGLRDGLADLGARAVQMNAPFADNTTAAAVRWLAP